MFGIISFSITLVMGIVGGLLSLHYKTVTDNYSSRLKSLADRFEATTATTVSKLSELTKETHELDVRQGVTQSELKSIHATMDILQNSMTRLVDATSAIQRDITGLASDVKHLTKSR